MSVTVSQEDFQFLRQLRQVARQGITHLNRRRESLSPLRQHPGEVLPGDVILNPLDARTPYWSPGDEARNEPKALTLAASLFPDRHNEQRFFTRAPREIFAHLLTYKLTPQDLAE
jgi:hypothetical protein